MNGGQTNLRKEIQNKWKNRMKVLTKGEKGVEGEWHRRMKVSSKE